MNISFRIRRERMMAAAVLGLALGGVAAALPARASLTADTVGTPVIETSDTTGAVTGTDPVLLCAASQVSFGSIQAVAVPAGCLRMFNGQWLQVVWSGGTGIATKIFQEPNGNLAVTTGKGKSWTAGTTFAANDNGPGCLALFEGNANLIVENCDHTLIWQTATSTHTSAVLEFESNGNVVMRDSASTTATALWSSNTNS